MTTVVRREGSWVCCQIGAREHYAVPRAIHSVGQLSGLVTDTWVPPGNLASSIRRIRERYHSELTHAPVYAWNMASIAFELSTHFRRLQGWPLIIDRNRWFQQLGLAKLRKLTPQLESSDSRPVLFAYSYAACDLLSFAKARGWQAILGQIDGGIKDEEIIANVHRRHQGLNSHWRSAPSDYWCSWKEECQLADRIIVNSHWSYTLLVDAGIDATKLHIIPVAYEAETEAQSFQRIYPTKFSKERPLRVLFLGAFTLRKGAAAVLEAISLLENEPVEFWIVGSIGVEVPSVFMKSPKAKWFGSVSRASAAAYYREADLFLFPTISDGFGMTQVEARGWKLPIITTPFCAPIVQPEVNGLVIAESDGELLANAMRKLLNDPRQLGRLAEGDTGEYEAYSIAQVRERILAVTA